MATSKIVLPNGTVITIDGKPEEIKAILSLYDIPASGTTGQEKKNAEKKKKGPKILVSSDNNEESSDTVIDVVTSIKESDDAEAIEQNVLDRSSQIDRILLPLYIIQKNFANKFGLTTGEIAKILTELGVPIHIANVSTAIKSSASKYVVTDKVRKKGQAGKYKLSRRGFQYMSSVIDGSGHGNKN